MIQGKPLRTLELAALKERETKYQGFDHSVRTAKPLPGTIEFRKLAYALPFLFAAGVFTGIAIMLSLNV